MKKVEKFYKRAPSVDLIA
jgi:hypothetical protein